MCPILCPDSLGKTHRKGGGSVSVGLAICLFDVGGVCDGRASSLGKATIPLSERKRNK